MIIKPQKNTIFGTVATDYMYNGLDFDETLYYFILKYVDDTYRTNTISVLAPARLIHVGEKDFGRQVWVTGNICHLCDPTHSGADGMECILCDNIIYSPVRLKTTSRPKVAIAI